MTPTPEPLSLAAFVPGTPSMCATMITRIGPGVRPTTFSERPPSGSGKRCVVDVVAERVEALTHDRAGLALVRAAGRPRTDGGDLPAHLFAVVPSKAADAARRRRERRRRAAASVTPTSRRRIAAPW